MIEMMLWAVPFELKTQLQEVLVFDGLYQLKDW
jgi:hypothetical protein